MSGDGWEDTAWITAPPTSAEALTDLGEAGFEPEWMPETTPADTPDVGDHEGGGGVAGGDVAGGEAAWADEIITPFVVAAEQPGRGTGGDDAGEGEAGGARPTLRRGSRGPAVRELQRALTAAGYRLAADGVFGSRTETAVRAFQARTGLTVDGIAGPATWRRLAAAGPTAQPATGTGTAPAGGSTATPEIALGTLVSRAPGRALAYRFTPEDLEWTAKLLVHEAGGRDDPDNAAVLWAMFTRYALFTHGIYPSFTRFVRAYSTTLQPVLRSSRAAARHAHRPEFVRTGGTYPGTDIPRGQLRRHLEIQRAPWGSLRASAREVATRALTGRLPNPGIGLASEFASTRIYFRQRHGRNPSLTEWRDYTTAFAASKRWRWVGDVPGLDQLKNAFFVQLSVADLPPDTVRVLPPGTAGEVATETLYEDAEDADEGAPEGRPFDDPAPEPGEEAFGEGLFGEGLFEEEMFGEEAFGEGLFEEEMFGEELFEVEEYVRHADFAATAADGDGDDAGATDFSPDGELESWAATLAGIPDRVRAALRGGTEPVAIRLLIATGVRDPNRLTNIVFHSRHPELGGRSIRRGERALAAEWLAIRDDLVAPLLRGPRPQPAVTRPGTGASAPAPAARSRLRASGAVRTAWHDDECRADRMVSARVLGRRTPVNPRTIEAWAALEQALQRTSYRAERVWVYNCRNIAGSSSRSLHAYGLAIDIDPGWNPNRRTPDGRPVRFSDAATQEQRLADVRQGRADTVFTPEQIAAVEAVRTVDGRQVFSWGGRWRTTKDTMHFEINVTPAELASGLATWGPEPGRRPGA